jgi:hypothetical protein
MMERCPNCGQLGRSGARFCTICGYRLADDDAPEPSPDTAPQSDPPETDASDDATNTFALNGWPTPPTSAGPGPSANSGWDSPPAESTDPGFDSPENVVDDVEAASFWAPSPGNTWPAPPADDLAEPMPASPEQPSPIVALAEETVAIESATNDNGAEAANPRERAGRLLDELRDAIATISDGNAIDLSGVISELEVAVTPPGAIDPDQLAALREALLAARERPRDLDTVVDLTNRLDAMVALVFAYDRTIAAIERALDVLRHRSAESEAGAG